MSDYLAPLPPARVAAWYGRLADRIATERIPGVGTTYVPLAAVFLREWLRNRNPTSTFRFDAPSYLQWRTMVATPCWKWTSAPFFLTEQRARIGSRTIWAGVVPRIRGDSGFTRWDLSAPLQMQYESLVEVGSSLFEIGRIQSAGTPAERDLLTSLRGFQLRSRVTVEGQRQADGSISIRFAMWTCSALDRYDWDYSEHFTVPNPDYGSRAADAVRPADQSLRVYHSNARRLEQANLAAPFNVESNEWRVTDSRWLNAGTVRAT
ncbi:MAG: hypothetical protein U5J83_04605 [Bryobacterales bacterium]|nr:hypothetical protein [Bryobacterales bacterium]